MTFQPRDTEQFVPFTSSTDTTVEGTEMLTAVLSNSSTRATIGQHHTATINITDVRGEYSVNTIKPDSYIIMYQEWSVPASALLQVMFDPSQYTVNENVRNTDGAKMR